jgi:hypothetical protein
VEERSRFSIYHFSFLICHLKTWWVVMQPEEWHGRPAREITRKMRVPHSNCITTTWWFAFLCSGDFVDRSLPFERKDDPRSNGNEHEPEIQWWVFLQTLLAHYQKFRRMVNET